MMRSDFIICLNFQASLTLLCPRHLQTVRHIYAHSLEQWSRTLLTLFQLLLGPPLLVPSAASLLPTLVRWFTLLSWLLTLLKGWGLWLTLCSEPWLLHWLPSFAHLIHLQGGKEEDSVISEPSFSSRILQFHQHNKAWTNKVSLAKINLSYVWPAWRMAGSSSVRRWGFLGLKCTRKSYFRRKSPPLLLLSWLKRVSVAV